MSTTKKQPSYTARELEEETGFDRRTIAYYVQEGLLPRVGRRGPRTRYPEDGTGSPALYPAGAGGGGGG